MTERSEPVEYAGLRDDLYRIVIGVFDSAIPEPWEVADRAVEDILRLPAITALEARARDAERERDALRDAVSIANAAQRNMADQYAQVQRELGPAEARIRELEAAVLAEREACAEVAERFRSALSREDAIARGIAAAIRTRTQADAPAQPVEEAGNG